MKRQMIFLFLLLPLLLAGCQTAQAALVQTLVTAPETTAVTAPVTEPSETVPATTEQPETEAPTEPPCLADCVEMLLPTELRLTPDCPAAEITVSFPRVELPEDARHCALTLKLDGEPLESWPELELVPGLAQKTVLTASFSLRDTDRTAILEATLCWEDQTLCCETSVLLDNDEPELYYAKAGEEEPYSIDVLRSQNVVIVYGLEDGSYSFPVKVWLCSTGYGTPSGTYWLGHKKEWGALFGGVYGQYVCGITGDILFHSVPYYYMSKDSLETEEYNKLGTTASMGCVRLPVEGAKWIYDNCPGGTAIHIYDTDELPVERPEAVTLDPEDPRSGWDPTDPDPENPWHTEP